MESIEERVRAVEERSKSNGKRLDKLEETSEAVQALATSMAVLAEKQDQTARSVDRLCGDIGKVAAKVDTLEKVPAKRWEAVVGAALVALVSAALGFILRGLGA